MEKLRLSSAGHAATPIRSAARFVVHRRATTIPDRLEGTEDFPLDPGDVVEVLIDKSPDTHSTALAETD